MQARARPRNYQFQWLNVYLIASHLISLGKSRLLLGSPTILKLVNYCCSSSQEEEVDNDDGGAVNTIL